jgi:hypothetical protein
LGRDDPNLDRDGLDQLLDLCRGPFNLGARSGHWSTWQAARVEVTKQPEATEREQHPVEQKVVKEMVAKTDVFRSTATPS